LSGSPIPVISRVPDKLEIRADLYIATQLDSIVRFEYLLRTVPQFSITDYHAHASLYEILLVEIGYALDSESDSETILGASPMHSANLRSYAKMLVSFCIRPSRCVSIRPACSGK